MFTFALVKLKNMIYLILLIIPILGIWMAIKDQVVFAGVFQGFCFGIILMVGLGDIFGHYEPSAMDVYQGKTILRKTYEGGKAIDSIVVFKKDIKHGKGN